MPTLSELDRRVLGEVDGMRADLRRVICRMPAKWVERLRRFHPWSDGSGRMSRSLQTLMIAREGVLAPEFSSIEAWLGRPGNTWEYYRELNGLVRRLRYEHAEGLSVQQAQRDLRDLTAAGILESVGRTRARYYTAGRGFPEQALTTANTPASLIDPYRR